jgi:hypothetical protein
MPTWDTVCEIVASLSGTQLAPDSAGRPTWRVDGRPLVRRYPQLRVANEEQLLRTHGEVIAVGAEPALREALLHEHPETFFITPLWSKRHAVLVWLDRVSEDDLRDVLLEAWHARARSSKKPRVS